ncbi:MAG: Ig-like domain-containing protein [Oscillospiraceae bacterium]|nr:Ig-like domain-containing protein [Oscillospiraceae bacterium]
MKLKKLLAAVTAAALAVTTMAVTSFTASADDAPIYSATLSATNGSTCYVPISGVDMDNVSKVVVSFDSETAINGGGGYMSGDNWTNIANNFSCAANGTSEWEIDVSSAKPTGDIQVQLWYIGGEGTISITKVEFQDSDGSAVDTISSPFSTAITKTETGSTSVEAIATVDYTKVAKVEVDVESSTQKGTSAKVGINQNDEGNWKDSGDIKVNDGAAPWTETWSITGLNGCVPSSLQVSFYSIDVGQVLSVNAIRFIDGDGKVLHSVPGGAASEPGEVSVTVTPATATVKAGETVQLEAAVTGKDDAVVTWTSTDTDIATVNASGLVTGVAKGSCDIRALVDGKFLGTPTSFSVVTVNEESGSDEVDTSGWKIAANGFTPSWGGWKSVEGTEGKLDFTCTIQDIMDANKITDIADFGGFIAQAWGVPLGDKVSYAIRIEAADGTVKANDTGTYTVVVNGGTDTNKDDPNYSLKQYQTTAAGGTLELAPTDVVKIVIASGTTIPTFPTTEPDPIDPPAATGTVLWEGNQTISWTEGDNVQIAPAKFADIKAGDTLKFTITCDANSQLKIAALTDGWPELTGPNPDPEWGVVAVSGTSYSFVVNADDVASLKEFGMVVAGQNATVTKIELVPKATPKPPVDPTPDDPTPDDPTHTHTPATVWSSDATGHWHACSGCDNKLDSAAHTSDDGTITAPATETTAGTKTYKCTECGYVIKDETIPATGTSNTPDPWVHYSSATAPVIPTSGVNNSTAPTINGKDGWEAVAAEITAASDGDKLVVDMNGATKVPSTVFKAIKGKDIDLVLNLNSSIKWTINGLSVTSTSAIDFDVTKNTKHIPNEVVDKAEGSHKRQISLDHNGSFGCNAVMSYDVGTQYNGLYANLFYYNRKAKELELIDCSPISGGKANFVFTHASDYLITISDEPLGDYEDVSSAAGIASDNSGVNSIAFCSVLAVITLAFGFVIYKKRRHN